MGTGHHRINYLGELRIKRKKDNHTRVIIMETILKIQSELGALSKTETNPFFKSKYLDINALISQLMPLLEKYGLTVIQPLSNIDGKPALETIIFDKQAKRFTGSMSGEDVYEYDPRIIVRNKMPLPWLDDPQKMGSAITYYRRYALQSLFLIQTEDDDANLGSGKKAPQTASQPQSEYSTDSRYDPI